MAPILFLNFFGSIIILATSMVMKELLLELPKKCEHLACSRLRDGGGKSFSNKKCKKRGGWGEHPFPSGARLIFALLVLIRSYDTIWEPGTG